MAQYLNKTSSSQLKSNGGVIYGYVVNSHTSGTVKLWDSLTASGTVILNTYTLSAGSNIQYFPAPISYSTGLFATIGGTADITFLIDG